MSIAWTWVFSLLAQVIGPLLGVVTPAIKAELNGFLTQLYLKALATPSPWDDFFVGLLLDILAIPRPSPVTGSA